MNDFKFSLIAAPGNAQNLSAKGSSVFYYEETGGGADVAVEVTAIGGGGGSFMLRPGEGVRLSQSADGFRVRNVSGANVIAGTMKIGDADFSGKNVAGSVSISNTAGAFAHTQETVTNASGSMLAAKSNRRYLLIQNNDTLGNIFVRTDGTPATLVTGIKIGPGESLELTVYVPVGEITAIGDIASNANVLAVEG